MAKGIDSEDNGEVRIQFNDGASGKYDASGEPSIIRKKGMTIAFMVRVYLV